MDRDDILCTAAGLLTLAGIGETALRLRDRNAAKARFLRERWTLEKDWERFDAVTGWELIPGYSSDDLRINRHGFRGPELTCERTRRVMCLGDSVTFGPPGEKTPYPYVARETLLKVDSELPVEVINAGVGGHSSANMRFRIPRLMRLKPAVTVVFAGWNDLFSEDISRYADHRRPSRSYWHITGGRNIRSHLCAAIAGALGNKPRTPVPVSYKSEEFVPFNFAFNLAAIIDGIRKAGSTPVLMTLPNLLPADMSRLTPAMTKKIMLPHYIATGDYEEFLTIYQAYDTIIRATAEETGAALLDTAGLIDSQKRPRSTFFEDTCHLSKQGHTLLGKYLAEQLIEMELIT